MRKCPACKQWTLDFDEYFGRFRCFNHECGWMTPSSAEREIRLLRAHKEPYIIDEKLIDKMGLAVTSRYDEINDALVFDFGLNEPSFDLPEGDGRMIWKIGHRTGSVAGFTLLGVREFGIEEVNIKILAKKGDIEKRIREIPGATSSGRASRILIESVEVATKEDESVALDQYQQYDFIFKEALEKLREKYPDIITLKAKA